MESEFCCPGFQQADTKSKMWTRKYLFEAALVVLCGKQSCERLLFQLWVCLPATNTVAMAAAARSPRVQATWKGATVRTRRRPKPFKKVRLPWRSESIHGAGKVFHHKISFKSITNSFHCGKQDCNACESFIVKLCKSDVRDEKKLLFRCKESISSSQN